ncbi:MAG: hypothetical protein ACXAEN_18595 [Candidatus Thorarchaeota archaeon]|jgi:hypothetical protein
MGITSALVFSTGIKDSDGDGLLPSQAGNTANEITLNNVIGTNNNGDLAASPDDVYTGRLFWLRFGGPNEEIRYINAVDGAGTKITLDSDFSVPAAEGDHYKISYNAWDADTVGNNWKVLLKRETDWGLGTDCTFASGAYFALLDGHSIETTDNSSTTDADVKVNAYGRFDVGYETADRSLGGGYFVGTPQAAGELSLDYQENSLGKMDDFLITNVKINRCFMNGDLTIRACKFYKNAWGLEFSGTTSLENVLFEGTSTVDEVVRFNPTNTVQSCSFAKMHGVSTTSGNNDVETIELRDCAWVGSTHDLFTEANKSWYIVNPVWDTSGIVFNGAGSAVEERYSLDLTTLTPAGDIVSGVSAYVYEGQQLQDLVRSGLTDTLGEFSADVLATEYVSTGTSGFGDHAVKVYQYGKTPFATAVTFNAAQIVGVALLNDDSITQASSGTAISDGAGISVTRDATTGPLLFSYDNGVAEFSENDWVSGLTSNDAGIIVETAGSASTGKIIIRPNTASDTFDEDEFISGATGYSQVDKATTDTRYTWEVDCSGITLVKTYDYLAAKMAEQPLDSIFEEAIEWGEDEQTQLIYQPSDYTTERNVNLTEGVLLSNRGAGNISYMTADDGSIFVPPTSITLTVTNVVQGTRCFIAERDAQGNPIVSNTLMNQLADSDGVASVDYIYTGDLDVVIRARKIGYLPFNSQGTITNSDFTVTAVWLEDGIVNV